jgi:N-acetylneuraminic acid mutarotase
MSSPFRRLLVVVSALVLVAAIAGMAYAQTPPSRVPQWTKAAPFPMPEEELYGSVVNGKFYVLGGFGMGGMAPGLVFEYDPATDRWTRKKDMPVKVHHQAQTPLNGKLYVFGGCLQAISGEGGTTNAWEWDPVADSWRALAPLTVKRC